MSDTQYISKVVQYLRTRSFISRVEDAFAYKVVGLKDADYELATLDLCVEVK